MKNWLYKKQRNTIRNIIQQRINKALEVSKKASDEYSLIYNERNRKQNLSAEELQDYSEQLEVQNNIRIFQAAIVKEQKAILTIIIKQLT